MLALSKSHGEDRGMERYVSRNDVFDDVLRFDAINRLRQELSLCSLDTPDVIESPLAIGIEIEMTWRQAFPNLAKKWPVDGPSPRDLDPNSETYRRFSEEYDANERILKPLLTQVQAVIPRIGADAYWEFSFLPTRNINVTIAELALLYEANILSDDMDYSLHMTVAGIDNDRDAFAFLCGLEQAGGTSADRIYEAAHSKKGAWSRKGTGGIMRRRSNELIGDDEVGYELRTLVCRTQEQINRILYKATDLTHLLQDGDGWKIFRKNIETSLHKQGLELKAWGRPKEDPTPWLAYAKLLDLIR